MTLISLYPFLGLLLTALLRLTPLVDLPRAWQWVPPVLIPMASAALVAVNAGLPGLEILLTSAQAGVTVGLAAIGGHHVLKRVTSKPVSPAPEPSDAS